MEAHDKPPPVHAGYIDASTSIASEVVRLLTKQVSENSNLEEEDLVFTNPITKRRRKGWGKNRDVKSNNHVEVDDDLGEGFYKVAEDVEDNCDKDVEDNHHPNTKGMKRQSSRARTKSRERRLLKTNTRYPSLKKPIVCNTKLQGRVLFYVREKEKEENDSK